MLNLINPRYSGIVYTAMAATGAAAAAMFNRSEAIKIIGLTTLTGVGYGIANDMIACRDCIEYFTVGHRYFGQNLNYRPLLTLNPNLNALVWGMIATWHVCAIAGMVLAAVARVPFPKISYKNWEIFKDSYLSSSFLKNYINFSTSPKQEKEEAQTERPFEMFSKITVRQLAPYMTAGAGFILFAAHLKSRAAQAAMVANPIEKYWGVPKEFQAGWEACNIRNSTGYAGIGIGGAALIVAMIAGRAGLIRF